MQALVANAVQVQLGSRLLRATSIYKHPVASLHDIWHILLRHDRPCLLHVPRDGQEITRGD